MARRRKRSIRKSTKRSSRRGGKGGGDWKKSTGLAVGLVGTIVVIWVWTFSSLFGSNAPRLQDFPWTFMAEGDTKADILVKKADGDNPPQAPFKENGKVYWEAYQCNNPDCPWYLLKENKGKSKEELGPYIFPYVNPYYKKRLEEGKPLDPPMLAEEGLAEGEEPPPMEFFIQQPECPLCKKYKRDPYMVERYNTPEGKKKMEELRKQWRERAKDE